MKKQLLFAGLALLSLPLFAQQTPAFGIRAGASAAAIRGDVSGSLNRVLDFTNNALSSSGRTGYYGGVYADLPLGGNISVAPALYYTQKGFELKGSLGIKGADFIGAHAKAALTTHYVDLPVLLKANLGGLQVFAGPQVSYLAGANLRTTAGLLGINILNRNMDVAEQFNRWDAALTGGIGYQFGRGLNISASYDHGLSRIDAGKSINAYNRSVKVGLGYNF